MNIIKWFLWRRWEFKIWIKGSKAEPLSSNIYKTNFGGCRKHPVIHRDMLRLLQSEQERANNQNGEQ